MKQKTAFDILKTGKNIFLTGSAGTGKTFILKKYIKYLKERGIQPAVIAPTGIAASHLNGVTVHSFFALGIRDNIDDYFLDNLLQKKYLHNRFSKLKVILIDEISMVSLKIFNSIDKILRAFKFSDKPFGGVQIIVSGDFFQLPPVCKNNEIKKFSWQSSAWRETSFLTCYLTQQFRQVKNDKLIKVLNEIRKNKISDSTYKFLKEKQEQKLNISFNPTKLYTHNIDVDRINQNELNKLKEKSFFFQSINDGNQKHIEKIFKSSLVTERLELKKGAIVLFVKNNLEKGYMNGSIGKIIGFSKNNIPIVKTLSGDEIYVENDLWKFENEDGKMLASVSQIPLKLAWAITIHKSQGMSLDVAEIDLSKTFEPGQGYVALSRIRKADGLRLCGFNKKALEVDPLILSIDLRMKESSQKSEKFINEMKDIDKIYNSFIKKMGGNFNKKENKKKELIKKNISTYQATEDLIKNCKDIEELVKKRNLSKDTVLKHLKKLKGDRKINKYKPSENILKKINVALKKIKKNEENLTKDGNIKLKIIYEYFNEEIKYDDIKLALLFLK